MKIAKKGKLVHLKHSHIEVGERARKHFDQDALDALGADIAKNGWINPITIFDKKAAGVIAGEEGHRQFLLLAGERRYRSTLQWKQKWHQEDPKIRGEFPDIPDHMENIPCHVFDWPLSPQEIKVIELHENVIREDFTPQERALLTKEIHEALTEIQYNENSRTKHTHKATADFMNVTRGTVSQDLSIADAMEGDDAVLKERVSKALTKQKALKEIALRKKEIVMKELSRRQKLRQEKGSVEKKDVICASYILGRFEEEIKKVSDRSIDFIELDPDYGIDFKSTGRDGDRESARDYEELPPDKYVEEVEGYLKEAYRVMKDNSWGVVWFSILWYKETYEAIKKAGFKVPEIPMFWNKIEGHTTTPAYRLNNVLEFFFYIRKGNPRIANMGRDNLLTKRRPRVNERDHAAEKPIELYEEIYDIFVHPGSSILVGFAGSGNAILAAYNKGHRAKGFDSIEENKAKFDTKVLTWDKGPFKTYDSNSPLQT
jgi:DNA modification methylase